MKNKIIPFASLILAGAFLFSCNSDDNENTPENGIEIPGVDTSAEFRNIDAATDQINELTSGAFNNRMRSNKFRQKMSDCPTQTFDENENGGTVVIDFGEGCELPDEMGSISGKILMTFTSKQEGNNVIITSNQTMENVVFNDMAVSGTSTLSISVNEKEEETTNISTKFDFTWENGLKATVEEKISDKFFIDFESFEFYIINIVDASTTFNNGDSFKLATSTPLRFESSCDFPVSGAITNTENGKTKTIDFGNGECDSIVESTDADGNTTTIDLNKIEEDDLIVF